MQCCCQNSKWLQENDVGMGSVVAVQSPGTSPVLVNGTQHSWSQHRLNWKLAGDPVVSRMTCLLIQRQCYSLTVGEYADVTVERLCMKSTASHIMSQQVSWPTAPTKNAAVSEPVVSGLLSASPRRWHQFIAWGKHASTRAQSHTTAEVEFTPRGYSSKAGRRPWTHRSGMKPSGSVSTAERTRTNIRTIRHGVAGFNPSRNGHISCSTSELTAWTSRAHA